MAHDTQLRPIAPPKTHNRQPASLKEWRAQSEWEAEDEAHLERNQPLWGTYARLATHVGVPEFCALKACQRARTCRGAKLDANHRLMDRPPCACPIKSRDNAKMRDAFKLFQTAMRQMRGELIERAADLGQPDK